jgi:lipoprotein-releasing system permease protein
VNTAFYIARRYLFAKKSTNAINIISAISMLGVMVGTAALIIILSVFNGFEGMVLKMFNSFTPQIVVEPAQGKTFDPNTAAFSQIRNDKSIYSFTEVLTENALVRYNDKQTPALVKGVSKDFLKSKALDSIMIDGTFVLENDYGQAQAVVGSALQAFIGVNPADPFEPLQVYSPKKGVSGNSINPLDDFNIENVTPAGVFEVQQDLDNMLVVPLNFARKLIGEEKNVSSVEINLQPQVETEVFKQRVIDALGNKYVVKNRIEQNQELYNLLGSEKWMVYIILSFVLLIAIFNIIGSLTMLVIEKQKDIAVLSSLGAGKRLIKRIFLAEGMMITLAGCIFGLLIGLAFCLLQQHFGWIKMGEANFIYSDAYPVAIKWTDFMLVFVTVSVFSFIAASLASNLSVKRTNHINQDL